jgi:L-rhamnose mutarotase
VENIQRASFVLRIAPERFEEYVGRHRGVYPELLQAFREVGFRTYSIFYHGGLLFNYLEAEDFEISMKKLSAYPAYVRWQEFMSDMLLRIEGESVSVMIPEVFYWVPQ